MRRRRLPELPGELDGNRCPTFTCGEQPQLVFTWGSEFPDKIKLRKLITIWPLRFKLRLDYTSATRAVEFGCSCKDSLFGGRIRLDVPSQQIEYRKRLHVGGGSHLGLTAGCSYAGLRTAQSIDPRASLAFEIGHSGAAIWAGNVFDLRHKLKASKILGVEVCGSLQLPVPEAQYTIGRQQQQIAVGQGPLHLHIAQVNVCIDL